jgi:O-acetyl-ADP-ribose deacetylase (regulator of RNase III)
MKIFISYKTGDDGLSRNANFLRRELQKDHDVWMDTKAMQAGYNWNDQIYREIPRSDVLILVLAPETKESQWVQREVDIARAMEVAILPVVFSRNLNLQETLDHFDLPRAHALFFINGEDDEIKKILESVSKLKGIAHTRQQALFGDILNLIDENSKKQPLSNRQSYKTYQVPEWDGKLHLATGDITEMRNVDVLVNPENSFMQMARIFETQSVSAKVRMKGAVVRAGTVREDTIQQQLLEQIKYHEDYDLPVTSGFVVPTTAGRSNSQLMDQGIRYLFHLVTVSVHVGADQQLVPIGDAQIKVAIRNVVKQIKAINDAQGVFFAEGRPEYEEQLQAQDDYQPIRSIAYPLFGTGRGGREDVEKVVQHMLEGVKEQLRRSQTTLEEIYINAYAESDLEIVETIMDEMFDV